MRHRNDCAIGVMAKAPQAGRSKTRLCPPLTPGQAAALSAGFLRDITSNLVRRGSATSDDRLHRLCPRGLGIAVRWPSRTRNELAAGKWHDSDGPGRRRLWALPAPRNSGHAGTGPWLSRGAEFRQSDVADGVPGQDRPGPCHARGPGRARSGRRRRLLPAWDEGGPRPFVRGHRLEHGQRRGDDAHQGGRTGA